MHASCNSLYLNWLILQLEQLLNGEKSSLAVGSVENSFNEQYIDTTVEKASGLLAVCFNKFIKSCQNTKIFESLLKSLGFK